VVESNCGHLPQAVGNSAWDRSVGVGCDGGRDDIATQDGARELAPIGRQDVEHSEHNGMRAWGSHLVLLLRQHSESSQALRHRVYGANLSNADKTMAAQKKCKQNRALHAYCFNTVPVFAGASNPDRIR
jgi:hypothetical protein